MYTSHIYHFLCSSEYKVLQIENIKWVHHCQHVGFLFSYFLKLVNMVFEFL